MRRRLSRFLAVLLLLACQHAGAQQIRFWTMQLSPFHDEYVQGVIRAFEADHPGVRVVWTDVPWAEMERKTLAAVAAQTAPDVVNLNPQFAAKLAEFGALADPQRYLSAADVAAYLPAAWRANRLDGKTFALPWYLNTNVILYNRDLMTRAGATLPTDLASLVTSARRVRRTTGSYAYFPALDGSSPLEALVADGHRLLDAERCGPGYLDAGGARVLGAYRTLYQEGLVPKNVVTEGHRKAVEMFLSGQVAMVSTGMQFLGYIKNTNPAIYGRIGVAGQLGAPGSPPSIAAMNVAVLESSAAKRAAFDFARFLTNADNQVALARRVPVLPSTSASYDDPFFSSDLGDPLLQQARDLSVRQALRGAVLVPPVRKYGKLRVSYARALQSVMLGKLGVDAALQTVGREWRAVLGCGA